MKKTYLAKSAYSLRLLVVLFGLFIIGCGGSGGGNNDPGGNGGGNNGGPNSGNSSFTGTLNDFDGLWEGRAEWNNPAKDPFHLIFRLRVAGNDLTCSAYSNDSYIGTYTGTYSDGTVIFDVALDDNDSDCVSRYSVKLKLNNDLDKITYSANGNDCLSGNEVTAVQTAEMTKRDTSKKITWLSPVPDGNNLNAIAFGNNIVVAAGNGGALLKSTDGTTFVPQALDVRFQINDIVFANNTFVAVGEKGRIITSTDGSNWQSRVSGTGTPIYCVTYGGGQFVAGGNLGRIFTSPDGIIWTQRERVSTTYLYDISWGNGVFVAVGNASGDEYAFVSSDGITWTEHVLPTGQSYSGICFGNGKFLAGGRDGEILISADGITWDSQSLPKSDSVQELLFADGHYLALSAYSLYKSIDGTSWQLCNFLKSEEQQMNALAYGNSRYYIAGENGSLITTDTLLKWPMTLPEEDEYMRSMIYENGTYVISLKDGGAMTSTDGTHWFTGYTSILETIEMMAFSGDRFYGISGSHIVSSEDGLNWGSVFEAEFPDDFSTLAYGGGIFLAGCYGGGVYRSENGTEWTKLNGDDTGIGMHDELDLLTFGNNRFVATVDAGLGERKQTTSENGTVWSELADGPHRFETLVFGNTLFVGAGYDGKISTSSDGVVWTEQVSVTESRIVSLFYENNQYIGVSDTGIISSPDGTNWTVHESDTQFTFMEYDGTRYLAMSYWFGTNDGLYVSENGTEWVKQFSTDSSLAILDMMYHDNTWFAVSNNSILKSLDAANWDLVYHVADAMWDWYNIPDLGYENGQFQIIGNSEIYVSENGVEWEKKSVYLEAPEQVVFGDGRFVTSSNGAIYTSHDSKLWVKRINGDGNSLKAMAYGNGTFVGFRNSGNVMTSPDGSNWTITELADANYMNKTIYADSKFVSVGFDGRIRTSENGASWDVQDSTVGADLISVAYGNGTFVAIGPKASLSSKNCVITSPDSVIWTYRTFESDEYLTDICFGNGLFIATGKVSNYSGSMSYFTSVDGVTWSIVNPVDFKMVHLEFGGGTFTVFGLDDDSNGVVYTSTDAVSWTEAYRPLKPATTAFFNGFSFYGYDYDGMVITNESGSWQEWDSHINLNDITFSNNLYVAVCDSGNIYTSSDLEIWETQNSGVSWDLKHIAYFNGVYLAWNYKSDAQLRSTDGKVWAEESIDEWDSVFANAGHQYISGVSIIDNTLTVICNGFVLTSSDSSSWAVLEMKDFYTDESLIISDMVLDNGLYYGWGYYKKNYGYLFCISEDGVLWKAVSEYTGDYSQEIHSMIFGNGAVHAAGDELVLRFN